MKLKLSERQILWGMILIYLVIFGVVTSLRHYNFQTQTWDLAAFVQSFWNAAHGRGLTNSLEQAENHLGVHWSPFLFLLVPGYFIFPTPYFLLIIQTLALAFGAWPLYLLSLKVLKNTLLSRVIAAAYLLYPGLQWANMYDFHEITFFVPLMLAALYFLEEKKRLPAAIFLALSAAVKEDAILAVLFVGIYLLLKIPNYKIQISNKFQITKYKYFAIAVIFISLLYFILAVKVFMPAAGGGVLRFDRYAHLGETPIAIVKNVIADPGRLAGTLFTGQKLIYLLWLFLPVVFLPIFSWRSLILLIPGLAENLLTNYYFQFSGLYHYDSILIPGIFVGAVYGLKNVLAIKPNWERVLKWSIGAIVLLAFLARSPIRPFAFPTAYFRPNPVWAAYRQMVKLVPPDASVASLTNLVPHLAHREHIYTLGLEPFLTDIILIDLADRFGFPDEESFQKYIETRLQTGVYKAQLFDERYLILVGNKYQVTF